jgi:hypothetical protein
MIALKSSRIALHRLVWRISNMGRGFEMHFHN